MQLVPKVAYRSDFRENTNFCPQRDSNLGPLAQQASVLPLDHCDHYVVMQQPASKLRDRFQLDSCLIRVSPQLAVDFEHIRYPENLVSQLGLDIDFNEDGLVIAGTHTHTYPTYLDV